MTTTEVENYPGFSDGIQGPELMDAMRTQAERFGAELIPDDVVEVDLRSEPKVVKTSDATYLGAHGHPGHRFAVADPGPGSEQRLFAHGVSACATCDGFFFRDQDIAVVGGGDSRDGGGDVPHPLRPQRHDRPPPRPAPRQRDHAAARVQQRQGPLPVEHGASKRCSARTRWRACACVTSSPASSATCPSAACSSRSGTTRAPTSSAARSTSTRAAMSSSTPPAPAPTSPACSPAVTSSTTPTGRPITAAGTGCAAALDAERWIAAQAERPMSRPRRRRGRRRPSAARRSRLPAPSVA